MHVKGDVRGIRFQVRSNGEDQLLLRRSEMFGLASDCEESSDTPACSNRWIQEFLDLHGESRHSRCSDKDFMVVARGEKFMSSNEANEHVRIDWHFGQCHSASIGRDGRTVASASSA